MFQNQLKDWDPADPIEYLALIARLLQSFRSVVDQEQLVEVIGATILRDISHRRDIAHMDAQDPLPPYFERKSYQYSDGRGGRGVLEVVFSDLKLVNVRAQYFLTGWFAKKKASRYLHEFLAPSLEIMLGPSIERAHHHVRFSRDGMFVIARYVSGTPSVSTYLVDEAFA
jgi:hypothetical protein